MSIVEHWTLIWMIATFVVVTTVLAVIKYRKKK